MNINQAHSRFRMLSPEQLISDAKENLLLFSYLNASKPHVIDTYWDMFSFNATNPIGGEALEIIISNQTEKFSGAVSMIFHKFDTFHAERKTDRIRLFYPALSYIFSELQRRKSDLELKRNEITSSTKVDRVRRAFYSMRIKKVASDIGNVQLRLRALNTDTTKPLTEILNPDWSDSYTYEESEVEYLVGVGKTDEQIDTNSLVMEFDTEEFEYEDEDFGMAGDGLHEAMIFNYAEMQQDMTVERADIGAIKHDAFEFVNMSNIYDKHFFSDLVNWIHAYSKSQNRFAFYVMAENYLPDDFIPQRVVDQINIHNMSVEDFEEVFGDVVLESILTDTTPAWTEINMDEIDDFHYKTVNILAGKYANDKSPTGNANYLQGYFKSLLNGANSKDANGAGWDNYRNVLSPDGQAAYNQAIKNGLSYKEAMRAFWTTYNNTIISFSPTGLTLKSSKINWMRAFYKAQAKEIPSSQIGKLISVAKNLLSGKPDDIWLRKIASLPI